MRDGAICNMDRHLDTGLLYLSTCVEDVGALPAMLHMTTGVVSAMSIVGGVMMVRRGGRRRPPAGQRQHSNVGHAQIIPAAETPAAAAAGRPNPAAETPPVRRMGRRWWAVVLLGGLLGGVVAGVVAWRRGVGGVGKLIVTDQVIWPR